MKQTKRIAALTVAACVAAWVSGCIPTAPETPAAPAPAAAPANSAAAKAPAVTTKTVTEQGKTHSELTVNPGVQPNASIELAPAPDGKGYSLKGTFNLSGTLAPSAPGKWLLKAEYRVAEADFAAGTPVISSVDDVAPGPGGVTVTQNARIVMVDLPVSPPAVPAPEGTPLRAVPVEAEITAPENAIFNVFFTTLIR